MAEAGFEEMEESGAGICVITCSSTITFPPLVFTFRSFRFLLVLLCVQHWDSAEGW
jgi:hypothetical protein